MFPRQFPTKRLWCPLPLLTHLISGWVHLAFVQLLPAELSTWVTATSSSGPTVKTTIEKMAEMRARIRLKEARVYWASKAAQQQQQQQQIASDVHADSVEGDKIEDFVGDAPPLLSHLPPLALLKLCRTPLQFLAPLGPIAYDIIELIGDPRMETPPVEGLAAALRRQAFGPSSMTDINHTIFYDG
jgi:hypothetical protein